MTILDAILALLTQAPQAITEIMALYNAVKADLSSNDQATLDAAFATAKASDASDTAGADTALAAASKA